MRPVRAGDVEVSCGKCFLSVIAALANSFPGHKGDQHLARAGPGSVPKGPTPVAAGMDGSFSSQADAAPACPTGCARWRLRVNPFYESGAGWLREFAGYPPSDWKVKVVRKLIVAPSHSGTAEGSAAISMLNAGLITWPAFIC